MQHWTSRRKASFIIHVAVVLVPFGFATASALIFWHALFQSWWLAVPVVAVIDALALLGLVLHIARIESPFIPLRHALPFISVVPLGLELYQLLAAHNPMWIAVVIALLLTVIMVVVAWRCYRTIERLFDSAQAADERLNEQLTAERMALTRQVTALSATMASLTAMEDTLTSAVSAWSQRPHITITTPPALTGPAVSRQQAKAYADTIGVSERTVWRRLDKGEVTAADVIAVSDEEVS